MVMPVLSSSMKMQFQIVVPVHAPTSSLMTVTAAEMSVVTSLTRSLKPLPPYIRLGDPDGTALYPSRT